MQFLKDIWEFFVKRQTEISAIAERSAEQEKDFDEINLAFESIMRIMSHIIATLPIEELDQHISLAILQVATSQTSFCFKSRDNI